ncbi:hypothetical protein B296_00020704 [Ensete ventricosum]|uniref:ENT domain-containing protein n=1 Tax=Ensete ventricosum TaxID=4639 RepID=A0A426ZL26_ENSVE|nr:hypothetical protein B296_00020704 [Ensete ventricosum]
MRLTKGSKVEVSNTKDVPSGSWRIAEIISGNGHNYFVRYARCPSDSSMGVERVPRKAIRPCPPPVEVLNDWMPGDFVEVFDNNSWKIAQVSSVSGGNYYSVKLSGCSRRFTAHKSLIRMRQSWQNNKWVVVQKVGSSDHVPSHLLFHLFQTSGEQSVRPKRVLSKGGKSDFRLTQSCIQPDNSVVRNHFSIQNHDALEEFIRVSSRATKKRKLEVFPTEESSTNASRKMGKIEKDGRHQEIVAGNLPHLLAKVGVVASARTVVDEKYMRYSLNNRIASITELKSGIPNLDNNGIMSLDCSDAESTSSSVGSCSISENAYGSPNHCVSFSSQDLYTRPGHEEMFYGLGRELSLPSKEELGEEIHQLELHAFRSMMTAFYASGAISWEQESLLTNLRLMLNISNDEYLLELRNLMSK